MVKKESDAEGVVLDYPVSENTCAEGNPYRGIIDQLRDGADADIWYDAKEYGDDAKLDTIVKTQQAMIAAANLLEKNQKKVQQKTKAPVEYWDSNKYNPDSGVPPTAQFEMEIDDQRATGQLYVTIAAVGGNLDDMFPLTMEINRLPESDQDMPCVHVHFDESNLAFSVFKMGDKLILRPEVDVTIRDYRLPSGEMAWIVEGNHG